MPRWAELVFCQPNHAARSTNRGEQGETVFSDENRMQLDAIALRTNARCE